MHLVLDANEYIFGIGPNRKSFCEKLLNTITSNPAKYLVVICRPIIDEVRHHLLAQTFKDFYALIF